MTEDRIESKELDLALTVEPSICATVHRLRYVRSRASHKVGEFNNLSSSLRPEVVFSSSSPVLLHLDGNCRT